MIAGTPHTANAPPVWTRWIATGQPRPLLAPRPVEYRSKSEQTPATPADIALISELHSHFADRPHAFERCAADMARMMLPEIASLDVTRPSRDGGRDAIGQIRIGAGASSILIDFALEAKCYALGSSVGVRELSRLISRLRHRQFGVLVTTSFVNLQAYQEIKEDQHPIVVISASDIVALLRRNGLATPIAVKAWLAADYPPD